MSSARLHALLGDGPDMAREVDLGPQAADELALSDHRQEKEANSQAVIGCSLNSLHDLVQDLDFKGRQGAIARPEAGNGLRCDFLGWVRDLVAFEGGKIEDRLDDVTYVQRSGRRIACLDLLAQSAKIK